MSRWDRLGARLQAVRGEASQRAFARELGVSPSQLARIEAGQAPTCAFLIRYGKTGRAIDGLLFGGLKFARDLPKSPACTASTATVAPACSLSPWKIPTSAVPSRERGPAIFA